MSLVDVEGDAEGEDEKEKEDDADKDKAEGHKYSHKRQGPSNKASIGPLYGVRVIDLADKSYCWASIGGQGKICLKQNCPTKAHKDKPATLYPKLKAQGLHEVVLVESTVDRAFADFYLDTEELYSSQVVDSPADWMSQRKTLEEWQVAFALVSSAAAPTNDDDSDGLDEFDRRLWKAAQPASSPRKKKEDVSDFVEQYVRTRYLTREDFAELEDETVRMLLEVLSTSITALGDGFMQVESSQAELQSTVSDLVDKVNVQRLLSGTTPSDSPSATLWAAEQVSREDRSTLHTTLQSLQHKVDELASVPQDLKALDRAVAEYNKFFASSGSGGALLSKTSAVLKKDLPCLLQGLEDPPPVVQRSALELLGDELKSDSGAPGAQEDLQALKALVLQQTRLLVLALCLQTFLHGAFWVCWRSLGWRWFGIWWLIQRCDHGLQPPYLVLLPVAWL